MKNKKWWWLLVSALCICLLISAILNFRYAAELKDLRAKINGFIPAAQQMETENARLRDLTSKQADEIFLLQHPLSSPSSAVKMPEIKDTASLPPLQNEVQPSFRDMNKASQP